MIEQHICIGNKLYLFFPGRALTGFYSQSDIKVSRECEFQRGSVLFNRLKQSARESFVVGYGSVCLQRLFQKKSPSAKRVIFFPDQMYSGTAGDLRACAVARELRSLGWRTIIVPPWLGLEARQYIIAREPSALLFFQQSRHELNLPRLYPSRLCIFDADDADILNAPDRVIECLETSSAVIAGSNFLADEFRPYNPNVSVVWTGSYITDMLVKPSTRSVPIIAWAQSDPFSYPEEARFVFHLWQSLAKTGLRFAVAVYSRELERTEEWLGPLRQQGIDVQIRPTMRYRAFVESLSDVAIGLQPVCTSFPFSRGKSFGKVLAYMAAHVPVVVSDEVDHGLFFRNGENGLLANNAEEWLAACVRLLNSEPEREMLAAAAYKDFLERLTSRRSAELVSEVLERVRVG